MHATNALLTYELGKSIKSVILILKTAVHMCLHENVNFIEIEKLQNNVMLGWSCK